MVREQTISDGQRKDSSSYRHVIVAQKPVALMSRKNWRFGENANPTDYFMLNRLHSCF